MSNAISSLIFACRNVNKATREVNPEYGRAPVAAAQGLNVINRIGEYDKTIKSGTEAATSIFSKLAKNHKVVDYAVKGTQWATTHINTMIAVSGGIKVLMAEDKQSTAIKEAAALSTMVVGERMAKSVLPEIIKSTGTKGKIISGLLFVGASIGSYALGEKLGDNLAKSAKANVSLNPVKINQMA